MYAVKKDLKYEVSNFQNEPEPWGVTVPTDNFPDITDKLNTALEEQLNQRRLIGNVVDTILRDIDLLGNGIDTTFMTLEYLTPFLANKNPKVLESAKHSFYAPLLREIQHLINGKPGPIKNLYNSLNLFENFYKGSEKRYRTIVKVA